MSQSHRLPRGGRIDRGKLLTIRFNGKSVEGYAGDTAASVLLANGVHFVARSFKYHRPRGIFSHGSEEPNALVEADRGLGRADPNNRATVVEAFDGLKVAPQNCWPTLGFDIAAFNNVLSPLLVAGFYYKMFMWPRSFWHKVYEPLIRAAAGFGRAPKTKDPERYQNRYAHCDVLVIGAGPAGLAATLAASETGKRVILADEQAEFGGNLLHDVTSTIENSPAQDWLQATLATLGARKNVIVLPRTTAFGYYNHNYVGLTERVTDHLADPAKNLPRERLWQVRAQQVILATGSHERPLVFSNNDRPGMMLAESIRVFINRYAVAPGRNLVFVTSGASAYIAAADAKAAGLEVTMVDLRPEADCGPEVALLRARGCEVLTGHVVLGSIGRKRVKGLIIAAVERDGSLATCQTVSCDCVGMSGGWTPAVHLFSQSRGQLRFEPVADAFVPGLSAQAERSAGAANGTYDLAGCLREGWRAGALASESDDEREFDASASFIGFQPMRGVTTNNARGGKAFVDFQNDVTSNDIKLAISEGFESIEHIKRYTTTGMATDQGKTSNMNALGLAGRTLDRPVASVGTTTFRPPYTPVTFGALIGPNRGKLFDPTRVTPIHEWAVEQGAVFEDVGLWKRARYFPKEGEDMHAAVARECKATRSSVGMFDASTLGKIEIVGPDAAEFMNRMYTNSWLKLEPGRCRYGLMLKEDGYIVDDGVVARLAHDRFHVTTTTGGAPRVLAHFEDYLQTEWPELKVFLTSITEQYAVIAVQGPQSREMIAPFVSGIDLRNDAFPHMSVRIGFICGVPCRLFRVSFTGEVGYEINVPSDYGLAVWTELFARGQTYGATPYGTEAMHVLRAEKGFIIVGQETDGTVTPGDVGLSGMIAKTKPDFVGKRSLARPDLVAAGRKQLVGLLTEDPSEVLEEGAQLVADPSEPVPMHMLGHVTSSYWSANCKRSIALALVADGRARMGGRLHVTTPAGFAAVTLCEPVFFDRSGERANA